MEQVQRLDVQCFFPFNEGQKKDVKQLMTSSPLTGSFSSDESIGSNGSQSLESRDSADETKMASLVESINDFEKHLMSSDEVLDVEEFELKFPWIMDVVVEEGGSLKEFVCDNRSELAKERKLEASRRMQFAAIKLYIVRYLINKCSQDSCVSNVAVEYINSCLSSFWRLSCLNIKKMSNRQDQAIYNNWVERLKNSYVELLLLVCDDGSLYKMIFDALKDAIDSIKRSLGVFPKVRNAFVNVLDQVVRGKENYQQYAAILNRLK